MGGFAKEKEKKGNHLQKKHFSRLIENSNSKSGPRLSMLPTTLARWSFPRGSAWITSRPSRCRSGLLSGARIQRRQRRRERSASLASNSAASTSTSTSTSELSCRHFDACSGCSLADDLAAPPAFREAAAWFRTHGVELERRSERKVRAHGWRCRARLAVRRSEGEEDEENGKPSSPSFAVDIGLFRSGTHAVSPIPDCVAHHPRINDAVAAIKEAVERLKTRVYSETRHARGGLRYLQLTAVSSSEEDDDDNETQKTPIHEDAGARIQLVLVWGSDGSRQPAAKAEAEKLARLLWEEHGEASSSPSSSSPPLFHSIFLNWQPSPGNSVMGPSYERFAGPELAWQRIAVEVGSEQEKGEEQRQRQQEGKHTLVPVALSPAAFSQANPQAFGSLVGELARVWSGAGNEGKGSGGSRIVALADLHAGAGAVGLSLAAATEASSSSSSSPSSPCSLPLSSSSPLAALERVVAVDCVGAGRIPLAAAAARLARRGVAVSVDFFEARAGDDPARWLDGIDAAVVDPPRKGLALGDPELLRVLCEAPPRSLRRFAYISCHFPSLRRDAESLLGGRSDGGGSGSSESNDGEKQNKPFWRLSHGAARIFFPGAEHVECLAVFERVD